MGRAGGDKERISPDIVHTYVTSILKSKLKETPTAQQHAIIGTFLAG